jgi:predicted transcriptional regulator
MSDYLDINAEISFPVRIQILLELAERSSKLNDLSEKFTVSKSEISRHLSRLIEVHFVTKDLITNQYTLTTLAENYISLFSPIEFLFKQKDFFTNHKLELPDFLSRKIDSLRKAELIQGSGYTLTKIQQMLDETNTKLQLILNQRYPMKLNKQIDEGYYVIFPEMIKQGGEYIKTMYKKAFIKSLVPVNHIVMICDSSKGIIAFPKDDMIIDINEIFYLEDKEGLNFLEEIFQFYWKKGESVNII